MFHGPPLHQADYDSWLEEVEEASRHGDSQRLFAFLEELLDLYSAWKEPDIYTQDQRVIRRLRLLILTAKKALYETGQAENLILPREDSVVAIDFKNITAELISHISRFPEDVYRLSSRAFEEFVAELLADMGWDVELTAATRDGGFDIFGIVKDVKGTQTTTSYLIDCKRYKPQRKVGVSVARELLHVKSDLTVANALIATTSDFSKDLYSLRDRRYDLQLSNRDDIIEWCTRYRRT